MSKVLLMIREFGSNRRNNTIIKIGTVLVITAILMAGFMSVSYSDDVNKGLADSLIRLHVIANSDTEADQALKRDVRDVIINYMKEELKDSKDLEHTRYIIQRDMDEITELAAGEIARHGSDYPVKAMLGSYPFPTKAYGDIILPAGNYQALRVVIGKGEGKNWWCVLFPPLCFVDATHGTIPDSVKEDLKEALSTEEFNIITSAEDEDDIPIKVKFKVVEFFQDSKIKFTGMISKIFKAGE